GTFFATPANTVGASIWSSAGTDGQSVYVTTGNGDPGSLGFSVIQLSPSLSQQGIWRVPSAQLGADSDFGGSPGVWTASIGGVPTPLGGACNKKGGVHPFHTTAGPARPRWGRETHARGA